MKYVGIKQLSYEEVQKNIRTAESLKNYNCEVQLPDWGRLKKVDENHNYLPKNFFFFIWKCIVRGSVCLAEGLACRIALGGTIVGKKNLRAIKNKNAIIVSSHVHNIDNIMVRWAVRGWHLYVTVAEFNNMTGFLGSFMRAGGTLPFSDNFSAMKNLSKAIATILKRPKTVVLYFPEKSMWPYYEQPRPFLNGAFHTAVVNDVPVVPMFFVWKEPGKFRRLFSKKKVPVLNILEPLYAKPELGRKENIAYLQNESFKQMCECYKENFGRDPDTLNAEVVLEEPFDKGYKAYLEEKAKCE